MKDNWGPTIENTHCTSHFGKSVTVTRFMKRKLIFLYISIVTPISGNKIFLVFNALHWFLCKTIFFLMFESHQNLLSSHIHNKFAITIVHCTYTVSSTWGGVVITVVAWTITTQKRAFPSVRSEILTRWNRWCDNVVCLVYNGRLDAYIWPFYNFDWIRWHSCHVGTQFAF